MMIAVRSKPLLFPLLFAGLLLFSCSRPKKPTFEPALSQARQYLSTGELQKALDSLSAVLDKYPKERTIKREYLRTLERMTELADKALESKDFLAAEKGYALLQKNYPHFKPVEESLSFTPDSLSRAIEVCRINQSQKEAEDSLQAGDYQKALAIYKKAHEEYYNEAGLSAGLKKTMEEIKRRAEEAAAKEDYVAAGKAYALLVADFSLYETLAPAPSFSKEALEEAIKKCRTQLTQKGLELYRKESLAEAIAVWQGILLFDPENIEIKKAIETATEHLKKLKKQREVVPE